MLRLGLVHIAAATGINKAVVGAGFGHIGGIHAHGAQVGRHVLRVERVGQRQGNDLSRWRKARLLIELRAHGFSKQCGVAVQLQVAGQEQAVALGAGDQLHRRGVVKPAGLVQIHRIQSGVGRALVVFQVVRRERNGRVLLTVLDDGVLQTQGHRSRRGVHRQLVQRVLFAFVSERHDAGLGKLAVRGIQLLLLVMGVGQQHVEAIGIQVAEALGDREIAGAAALFLRLAVGGAHVEIGLILAQDEVHHTGHGVGAVHGGRAVAQHFNAFHSGQRNAGQVNGRTGAIRGHTAAIQQHQGVASADIVQRGVLHTTAATVHRLSRSREALHGGQALNQVFGALRTAALDVRTAQGLNWQGTFAGDPFDG